MIKLALHSALSDRAADGKVVVVDSWSFDVPKTKDAKKLLSALGIDGKALVVVDIDDTNTIKSFLNLPDVQLIETRELNAYDVLCSDYVVFSHATLPGGGEIVTAAPAEEGRSQEGCAGEEGAARSGRRGRATRPSIPPYAGSVQGRRRGGTRRVTRSRAMPRRCSTTCPVRRSTTERCPSTGSPASKMPRPPGFQLPPSQRNDEPADGGEGSASDEPQREARRKRRGRQRTPSQQHGGEGSASDEPQRRGGRSGAPSESAADDEPSDGGEGSASDEPQRREDESAADDEPADKGDES